MSENNLINWIDARFPLLKTWNDHFAQYYVPKNFNIWYVFGSLALVVLVSQFMSGIWLAMYYIPTDKEAFASIEHIMRDVNYGWLLRYLHTTGASAFFIIIYLHMFRGLMYGSYKRPRELVWLLGMMLYLVLLAEAFMGYVLPWGQMSYWGGQVIINLFSAIPYIGPELSLWIRGDYNVSGVTLHRFFALHIVALPIVLLGLVGLHIVALHKVGSNNPDGIDIKAYKNNQGIPIDGIPFHPYYTVKDLFGIVVFLIIFAGVLFFMPDMGGYFLEPINFIPADPLQTPTHIAPTWYMTPFYAMLRAVPDKLFGIVIMAAAIAILFVLPWLDRSPVKSIRYRGMMSKVALILFVISFLALIYLGSQPVSFMHSMLARVFTIIYFLFFLLMPFYTKWDKTKPVPERLT
ncbi:cytochrome bc complex cytochrome b subunit [soil metagenome]